MSWHAVQLVPVRSVLAAGEANARADPLRVLTQQLLDAGERARPFQWC